MSKRFVDDAAMEAFTGAIRGVEAESSVEVVIKVRHHSGSYRHADLMVGIATGLATLAFMLFSPSYHFSTLSLFIDPIIVGLAFGLFTTQLPFVRRHLTRARTRRAQVRQAAESGFYLRGVSHTSGRSGILVYVSLLEREVELVCDRGVTETLTKDELEDERARMTAALRDHFDASSVAKAITELKTVCGARMPRAEDDVNELPDQVYFHP